MRRLSIISLDLLGLVPSASAANVISLTASGGGTYTIVSSGGDDQVVEFNSPGTFTITADNTSSGATYDGYINTVKFGSGATDGTYNVRIARNTAGDFYSTGARNVGWVDLASGSKRGNLKGDMDGDHLLTNFDIDPFTDALTNPSIYNGNFPWLVESRVYHGNVGPATDDVCTPDNLFNNFDIDCFVALLYRLI